MYNSSQVLWMFDFQEKRLQMGSLCLDVVEEGETQAGAEAAKGRDLEGDVS